MRLLHASIYTELVMRAAKNIPSPGKRILIPYVVTIGKYHRETSRDAQLESIVSTENRSACLYL